MKVTKCCRTTTVVEKSWYYGERIVCAFCRQIADLVDKTEGEIDGIDRTDPDC
jgi:hypothetical protein